jgi:MoaA/NifB/PqqE/SkfB family radical SAM enzyme
MHRVYPRTPKKRFEDDLAEIVLIACSIAHNEPVPDGVQSVMTLSQYAKHLKGPQRMDLIVAPMLANGKKLCPLDCGCCYAADQPLMKVRDQLSTQQWKEIIDHCRAIGIPQLTFTGGEPLSRADIVELVHHAEWHVTFVNTNGVGMTPEMAQAFVGANLDGLQITLYSHDGEAHDRLVGREGAWKKTVDGVRNAVDAGLNVSINTPLVPGNADYASTVRFIHSLGVRYVTCSGLFPAGAANARIRSGEILGADALFEALKSGVEACRQFEMEIEFTSPGCLEASQLKSLGLTVPICGACLSNMAVAPDGTVVACQSWLHDREGLGNMLSDTWQHIWNHRECRRLRFSPECTDCRLKEA